MATIGSRLKVLCPALIVAACSSGDPATPTIDTQYFTSTTVVEVLADVGAVSPIYVTNFTGTVTDVKLTLDMESLVGSACEWSLGVKAPDGSVAGLMSSDAPSCRTAIRTTFPTETLPLRSFGVFNGKPAEGRWELSFGIEDGGVHDAVRKKIRLNKWILTITVQR